MFEKVTGFIKKLYGDREIIPLHEPKFIGNEKRYLNECIESTYVSYVGEFVTRFEDMIKGFTGSKHATATANGTSALHMALLVAGVERDDEVLTQALTFVATANAISHCGAKPVFIDSEKESLGMSPDKLEEFLKQKTVINNKGYSYNKDTGKRISVCLPVHVFGHPFKIHEIEQICAKYNIVLVEDAAESLGSFYKERHTGTFGKVGILSFNGNKTITTGGGGMLITDDDAIAQRAKHLATTAKIPHKWQFIHDAIGYNYRMPNINAAVGCAQMENLEYFLKNKRETASLYEKLFSETECDFFVEPKGCKSNYWLNAIILKDREQREGFLEYTHKHGVMTRPVWNLINGLPMYKDCQCTDLHNAEWLADRMVNIPSSVRVATY